MPRSWSVCNRLRGLHVMCIATFNRTSTRNTGAPPNYQVQRRATVAIARGRSSSRVRANAMPRRTLKISHPRRLMPQLSAPYVGAMTGTSSFTAAF